MQNLYKIDVMEMKTTLKPKMNASIHVRECSIYERFLCLHWTTSGMKENF